MSTDYYPVAEKADRVLDVIVSEDGVLQIDQRQRDGGLNWTGLKKLPSVELKPGESVEFTFSIPEQKEAMFAVQARDWPSGYPPPKIAVLGRLDPMGDNGVEIDTKNTPGTYRTHEVSCEFARGSEPASGGTFTTRIFRFRRIAAGTVVRDPSPVFTTTLDLKALKDGAILGTAHAVLRLPPKVPGALVFTKGNVGGETRWEWK